MGLCNLGGQQGRFLGGGTFLALPANGKIRNMLHLTDADLISRLKNFEDHFIERKTSGDDKYDWVKAAVAFANSAPIDFPCVLYIGVRDNGEIEEKRIDLNGLQKKFNKEMTFVYPRIPYLPKILKVDGRQCLAVIVPGSPERPHFAGPAYIRKGSETIESSDEQFGKLIAQRNSAAYQILQWKGQLISFHMTTRRGDEPYTGNASTVVDCNQFFVTLQIQEERLSFALRAVDISFDHRNNRPALGVSYK